MSLIVSTQSELLKTKRTASFWLSLAGAAFIPTILFIALFTGGNSEVSLANDPWRKFTMMGWNILSVFLLPMYIILVTTLITQIEFKNNTWKQVYATPQTFGNIFFSKFLTIHLMIVFCFLVFNTLMIVAPLIANLFLPNLKFIDHPIDWRQLLNLNAKSYLSILGITAIQYCLSLRFKNFIVPVGIGLVLVIINIVAINIKWKYISLYPYSFPMLSFESIEKSSARIIENHELNSIAYFIVFILIGFADMKMREERG